MTKHLDYANLIDLLDKAEKLAGEFQGGHLNQFLSAEEFHKALLKSIDQFKRGDNTQIQKLRIWFAPTSSWDDFVGKDGQGLANEISGLLSLLKSHDEI